MSLPFDHSDEVCILSIRNFIYVTPAIGPDLASQFFKASSLERNDDIYVATLTHGYDLEFGWRELKPNGPIIIPAHNLAGYQWKRVDAPIANGRVDLEKLRAALNIAPPPNEAA